MRSDRVPTARAQKAFLQSAQVLVAKPFGADGRELPSSVLKFDTQATVEAEAALMEEHGKDWGATSGRGCAGLSAGREVATFVASGALAGSPPSHLFNLARPAVVPGSASRGSTRRW